jgi:hypothetical protein
VLANFGIEHQSNKPAAKRHLQDIFFGQGIAEPG